MVRMWAWGRGSNHIQFVDFWDLESKGVLQGDWDLLDDLDKSRGLCFPLPLLLCSWCTHAHVRRHRCTVTSWLLMKPPFTGWRSCPLLSQCARRWTLATCPSTSSLELPICSVSELKH